MRDDALDATFERGHPATVTPFEWIVTTVASSSNSRRRRVASTLTAHPRRDFTGDYGAAGAVDLYGPRYGLPRAISGHNSYWWWGATATDGATIIAVDLPRDYLTTIFAQVTPAGSVETPHGIWTEERGDPIWICREQKVTWANAWPDAKHYG